MKILKGLALIKLLILTLLLVSVYLTRLPDQPYHPVTSGTAAGNFHIIEFNDEGEMHLPEQWQALQQRIASSPMAPELLIFIHGWHHNAAPSDENLVAFRQFHREMAQRSPQQPVLALYIGWRGDQFDPFWLDGSDDADSNVEVLDFPTIADRKRVAQKVGERGVSQLLDGLDALTQDKRLKRYVLLGHSLGGAIGLYASKQRIMRQLEKHQSSPNLTILLNPAVTAATYKPLDRALSLEGDKPSMIVLQSKGDFAVKKAFNWLKTGERALGNSWAITHDIDKCPDSNCQKQVPLPEALKAHDALPGCMMVMPGTGWKIRARLQARRTVKSCQDANRQAVWVLAVSDDIINGHNGILTRQHAGALAEVLTLFDWPASLATTANHESWPVTAFGSIMPANVSQAEAGILTHSKLR